MHAAELPPLGLPFRHQSEAYTAGGQYLSMPAENDYQTGMDRRKYVRCTFNPGCHAVRRVPPSFQRRAIR